MVTGKFRYFASNGKCRAIEIEKECQCRNCSFDFAYFGENGESTYRNSSKEARPKVFLPMDMAELERLEKELAENRAFLKSSVFN